MARLARTPTSLSDDDDDEFPDISRLVLSTRAQRPATTPRPASTPAARLRLKERTGEAAKPPTTVRRRKLGPLTDNLLLRAWTPNRSEDGQQNAIEMDDEAELRRPSRPSHPRVELRPRTPAAARNPTVIPSSPAEEEDEEYVSAREEITITEETTEEVTEEASIFDNTFHSCSSEDLEDSEFQIYEDEDTDDADDDVFGTPPRAGKSPAKQKLAGKNKKTSGGSKPRAMDSKETKPPRTTIATLAEDFDEDPLPRRHASSRLRSNRPGKPKDQSDLADFLEDLQIGSEKNEGSLSEGEASTGSDQTFPSTATPPRQRPGLISPKKLPRIPNTPHRPSSDLFWSQEFIDDWNDEHSPRKQLFPEPTAARQKSPAKDSTKAKPKGKTAMTQPSARQAKKAFEETKHQLAEKFLQELDETITSGKIRQLTASTGGVKLIWSNKLNTTAGRAHWKSEVVRTTSQSQPQQVLSTITHQHASIELASKVIDDEHRLLNTLAHEFCHLANYMVSGVKNNPHGAEFQEWGRRVTAAFAHRGVQVTTKHNYAIDFKYVWECTECYLLYKRHSKSIDTNRQRCGGCKGVLKQVKPVPRGQGGAAVAGPAATGEGGNGSKNTAKPAPKVTEYQAFMKEQMRVVRVENPGSPQKEIMKIVAGRWAAYKEAKAAAKAAVVQVMEDEVLEVLEGSTEGEDADE
ncbi:hypothetical protein VTJ49DRAFT_1335 [Mycothermus thermophilus]|uniref:SprT-like domain-containing protein n=1 Tax=Humicola insolens TaxID=85995 RepID=A0ABR3VCS5_HUMIN